ncbi:ALF repeat-containing protein [Arthrobacter sp. CDRTa11]|uniref:ALF repeat-containing protein n=1 Tax=Arthrobacter sp. CDRTa11 TaxID=2651199 RepID=UPI00226580BF|nr:ALF repeat-containing protein [Arthrobacter sp. CDRTa11]
MITVLHRALRQFLSAALAVGVVLALVIAAILIPSTAAHAASEGEDRVQAYYLTESEWARVRLAAQRALDSNSPVVIREFLRYGQYLAAAMDQEEQAILLLTGNAESASLEAQSQRLAAESFLVQANDPQLAIAAAASAKTAAEAARAAAGKAAEAVKAAQVTEQVSRAEERARFLTDWAFRTAEAKAANLVEDARLAAEAESRINNPEPYPTDEQITADRQRTYQYLATGTPHVRSSAEKILQANDPLLVRLFLVEGVFAAEELDNRIYAYGLLEAGGLETRAGADVAIDGTREMLRTFFQTEEFRLAVRDQDKGAHVIGIQARISVAKNLASQAALDAAAAEAAAASAATLAAAAEATRPPSSQTGTANSQAPVQGALGVTGGTALNAGLFGAASSPELPAPADAGVPAELAETPTPAVAAAPPAGKASSGTGDADKKAADMKAAAPQASGTQASQNTGLPLWAILLGLGVLVLAVACSILVLRRRRIPA